MNQPDSTGAPTVQVLSSFRAETQNGTRFYVCFIVMLIFSCGELGTVSKRSISQLLAKTGKDLHAAPCIVTNDHQMEPFGT